MFKLLSVALSKLIKVGVCIILIATAMLVSTKVNRIKKDPQSTRNF